MSLIPEDDYHEWRTLYCRHCGHHFRFPIPCKDRYCPVCSKVRSAKVRRRLKALCHKQEVARPNSVRFLTLTITSNNDLAWMIRTLVRSFRKLRQLSSWKKRVTGGAFVIEITKSENGWHAHIHALISGEYFPFKKLLELWIKCSPGRGVYLKQIPSKNAADYLTKYVTKANDKLHDEDIRLINNTLKGTRLFQPFGEWFGWSRELSQLRPPCPECASTSGYCMDWDLKNTLPSFDVISNGSASRSSPRHFNQQSLLVDTYIDPF